MGRLGRVAPGLAYSSVRRGFGLGVAALTLLEVACTAGVKPAQTTGGGSGGGPGAAGTSGAAGGSAAGTGTGGSGVGGQAGTFVSNPDAGACQQAEVKFTPKNTTVFVLVDRSGSEFDSETTGIYFSLRAAVLQVIQQIQQTNTQVRFGFGAFVGNHGGATCLPVFDSVPIGTGNYDAIATKYNALGPLLPYGTKSDTPASAIIPMVKAALKADTGNGQKYMLFVTDSESDFCDDVNAVCAADAVTYELQDMYAAQIGTLLVGLPTNVGGATAATARLQTFANAGAGQGVVLPSGVATTTDVYYQCSGQVPWMSLAASAGRTGMVPLATYSATAGTATVYTPASTQQQALVDQLSAALADVKSCTFDLSDASTVGHAIKVVRTKLDKASVVINGTTVPLDATDTNGWDMISDTQLQLFGPACNAWRDPNVTQIDFNFPCEIIIG